MFQSGRPQNQSLNATPTHLPNGSDAPKLSHEVVGLEYSSEPTCVTPPLPPAAYQTLES